MADFSKKVTLTKCQKNKIDRKYLSPDSPSEIISMGERG